MNRKFTNEAVLKASGKEKKPELAMQMYESDEDSDEAVITDIAANFGNEIILGPLEFKPVYKIGTWQHPSDKESMRVSASILLPSGVGEQDDDMTINIT